MPTLAEEGNGPGEPTVHLETACLFVASPCFAMAYDGWTGSIFYAESQSALPGTWTKNSSAIVTGHTESCWVKVGSTYHLYASSDSATHIDHYSGMDMLHLSLAHSNVIVPGIGMAWDSHWVLNCAVLYDSGTFLFVYEGNGNIGVSEIAYDCGLATSTDGFTFTKYGSDPVSGPVGASVPPGCSGPWLEKVSGTYWLWMQFSNAPSDLYRRTGGTFPGPFPLSPSGITFARGRTDEISQVADPCLVEYNGKVYLFYSAVSTQTPDATNPNTINLAIYNGTLAQLVLTSEGVFTPNAEMTGVLSGNGLIQ